MLLLVIVLALLLVIALAALCVVVLANADLRHDVVTLKKARDNLNKLREAAYELLAHELKTTHTFTDSSGGPYARSREVQKNNAVDRFTEVLRVEIDGEPQKREMEIEARALSTQPSQIGAFRSL